MEAEQIREAFARHAGGVVVISASTEDGFRGLTATSFIAVSLEPPLVAVALDSFASTRDAVVTGGQFSVSVLERGQEFAADRFAGRAPLVDPRWSELAHSIGANGLPLLDGCLAWFECAVQAVHSAGDHDLVIGSVRQARLGAGEPLLLWERRFWGVGN